MPLSSIFKQIEELLEEVLRTIREECDKPYSVLCELGDRNKFVEEERSLRKQLKEMVESESNSRQWWRLTPRLSPQAAKCLKDAQDLHQRIKEYINEKVRTRLTGMNNPPPSASNGQGSAFNMTGTGTPEIDTGRPLADANPEPASTMITSPLNMRCSSPEVSELIVYPAVRNDNDDTSDLNEPINTPREMFSDRGHHPTGRPRASVQSSDLYLLSETTINPGSDSTRRSHSVRRSVPSPQLTRQLRIRGSPINRSFPSPGPVSELTQQAQGRRRLRCSEEHVTKTNCAEIIGSDVVGMTMNTGGSKNSGSVIHQTVLPPHLPQPVP